MWREIKTSSSGQRTTSALRIGFAALFMAAILTLWIPADWPMALFEAGVFMLAAASLMCHSNLRPTLHYPFYALSFAVAWGLLQCLTGHTVYAFATQNATVRWASFLAVFLTGSLLFADSETRDWFRLAMVWFAFMVSVIATLQTFTGGGKIFWLFPSGYPDNVMGPILSRNHYAAFIEVALPMALYESLTRRRSTLLYSGMAAGMYASVIASGSRAGTVLATAEIVAMIALTSLLSERGSSRVGAVALQMIMLFGIFTLVVGWERVWSRFWVADPMTARREFNISSLHMIADHPWLGTGLGTWPVVYPHYAITDVGAFANQAHDDWLQWTAEGGLPFAIVIATLFLWSLRPAISSIWGIGVIAVFLHAFVDYPFSRPALGSWPILLISMLATRNSAHRLRVKTCRRPAHLAELPELQSTL